MFGLSNAGEYAGSIQSEFEHLMARIRGLWLTEHKEDGTHEDINADSLTLTANTTSGATGNLVADGSGTFDGNVTADADGRPVEIGVEVGAIPSASGVRMTSVASGVGASDWSMESTFFIPSGAQSSLVWQDQVNRAIVGSLNGVMVLGRNTNVGVTPAEYTLYPGGPTSLLNIGLNSPGYRINGIVANTIICLGLGTISTLLINNGLQVPATVTLANGATYDFPNGASALGRLFITSVDQTANASFYMRAGTGATQFIDEFPANMFTATAGTANRTNVFYNGGTGTYRIENLTGAQRTYYLTLVAGTGII